jgi:hypothetical protein
MSLFRFEHRSKPLATGAAFVGRLAVNFVAAILLASVSLGVGMAGYHATEGMDWLDAFLNASMLLGGMGPVDALHTEAGKLFAGCYALFCGLIVVITAGVILAPILHRVMHTLHAEAE